MSIANIFDNLAPNMPVELSSNIVNIEGVPYLDANNTFTGLNTFNGITDFNSSISMSGNSLTIDNATPNIIMQNSGTGNYYLIRSPSNPGQSTILTLYDPGTSSCNLRLGVASYLQITGTITLTIPESGTIFDITAAGAYTITLPSPTPGTTFTFIIAGVLAGAVTIHSSIANIVGNVIASNATQVANSPLVGNSNVIIGTTASVGDTYVFYADSRWVLRGLVGLNTSVTFS
jgi:hypothetical protein